MTEIPTPRHDPDAIPPCPVCGAALDVSWLETQALRETVPRLYPGRTRCDANPLHDVSPVVRQFVTVEIAHHEHGSASCPLYLLDRWRTDGWFPTDLEHQTPAEAVEHRVWLLART